MNRIFHLLHTETEQLDRWTYLPHAFKRLGWGLFLFAFPAWFFLKGLPEWRLGAEGLVLIGLLLIAVSQDRIEDEYTLRLRARAFAYAFVIGVLYAVIQPLFNWAVAAGLDQEGASWESLPSYAVLWFMLVVQIGFYQAMKWSR